VSMSAVWVAAMLLTLTLAGAAAADGNGLTDLAALDCGVACQQQQDTVVLARATIAHPPAETTRRSRRSTNTTKKNSANYRYKKDRAVRHEKYRQDRRDRLYDYNRSRYGYSGNHQPGGSCIFDAKGKVVLRPKGVVCQGDEDEDGFMAGSAGDSEAIPAKRGTTQAPGKTGCVQGDCKSGTGTYVWSNGAQYVGQFRNGLQGGQGSLILPDGSSYVGQWRVGKRHGQGTGTYADGRVQKGMWQDNRFAGSSSRALLKILWPDLSKPASEVGGGKRDAAVIVGVEKYAHVAQVPNAADNASDWYGYLAKTRQVPLENLTLMLDADATVEEMRRSAQEAAKRVKKGGTLWFVFVGHGAPAKNGKDGLLVGFDAQQKARSIESRSLPRSELLATLADSKAKNIQVLIDACFSGRSGDGEQLVAGLQPLVVTTTEASRDPRLMLMTAAGSNEYAGPLPGASRPAFSYLALGGLRGWADGDTDGKVTAGELHGYVTQSMRALIRDRRQRPTLVGKADRPLGHSAREKGPDLARKVLESARSGH